MKKVNFVFISLVILISLSAKGQTKLAAVKKGEKWGFIDEKGDFVIDAVFDNVLPFHGGLAAANIGYHFVPNDVDASKPGKWGFIDKEGNWVIEPQFEMAESFSEGFAKVNVGARYRPYQGVSLMGGKWGFIEKSGKWFIQPNDTLYEHFSEGYCAFKVPKGSKWGFVDHSGKTVIKPVYWEVAWFSGSVCPVMRDDFTFIYINKSGKQVFGKSYQKAYPFREERAFVKEDDLSEFIGKGGEYFFKIENLEKDENISPFFYEGLVKLRVKTDKGIRVGYANKSGKWIVQPVYELGDDFHDGLALVFKDLYYTFIDPEGKPQFQLKDKMVENPEDQVIFKGIPHPNVGHFSQGLCSVKDGSIGKWGFIDKKGHLTIPAQFDGAQEFTSVE